MDSEASKELERGTAALFSVIIPVYNVEDYLRQCVDSVLAQGYANFEVVLVDDGSKDSSGAICDAYANEDARVRVIHQENAGLSAARNRGIREATGEYLLFLDSDDWWDEADALERAVQIIEQERPDVIHCANTSYYMTAKNTERREERLDECNGMPLAEALSRLVRDNNMHAQAGTYIVSSSFLCENDLFFVEGIKSEDIEWLFHLLSLEPKIRFWDAYYYYYRKQRPESITSSVDSSHLADYAYIIEKSIEYSKSAPNEELRDAMLDYAMYQMVLAIAHVEAYGTPEDQRKYQALYSPLCKELLGKHQGSKRAKMAYKAYRATGYRGMSLIAGKLLLRRKR